MTARGATLGARPPLTLPRRVLSDTLTAMRIGELLRVTRERHGLTQARLARRIGADRSYVSRVERGEVSPTFDWVERALAAMGEELALGVRRSRFDDHDPAAHRLVGAWDPDRRLEDFVASAGVLDELAGSPEASTARSDPDERPRAGPFRPDALAGVLNAHGVDYVVVGGVAAIRHGSRRTTRELDIVPAPSPANSRRLAAAL